METVTARLTASHVLGLSIFSSYFVLIFFLLYIILSSIHRNANFQGRSKRGFLFGGLTTASLAHTGYWMFHFMAWSFYDFEATRPDVLRDSAVMRVASWLTDTALFEQAWSAVCTGPLNWWWSEQLCLFTVGGFTLFLYLQRDRVPHVWAYMLLGQVVAISVAWSLLNLALVLISPPRSASKTRNTLLPPSVTIPILLSLLAISLSPYTTPTTFFPNLLAMHALLILPLLPIPTLTPSSLSPRSTSFYTLIALLSLLLRTRTTLSVLASLHITSSPFFSLRYPADLALGLWNAPEAVYAGAWRTLHSHPAQASIGWDIMWTGVVWLAWGVCRERGTEGARWNVVGTAMQALQVAVASVGVVAPMEFGRVLRDEDAGEHGVDVKTE